MNQKDLVLLLELVNINIYYYIDSSNCNCLNILSLHCIMATTGSSKGVENNEGPAHIREMRILTEMNAVLCTLGRINHVLDEIEALTTTDTMLDIRNTIYELGKWSDEKVSNDNETEKGNPEKS